MSIVDENLEILLKGGRLVKEIFPQCNGLRSWLEISINSENIGPYPLRLPPYAMLQGPPYSIQQKTPNTHQCVAFRKTHPPSLPRNRAAVCFLMGIV